MILFPPYGRQALRNLEIGEGGLLPIVVPDTKISGKTNVNQKARDKQTINQLKNAAPPCPPAGEQGDAGID